MTARGDGANLILWDMGGKLQLEGGGWLPPTRFYRAPTRGWAKPLCPGSPLDVPTAGNGGTGVGTSKGLPGQGGKCRGPGPCPHPTPPSPQEQGEGAAWEGRGEAGAERRGRGGGGAGTRGPPEGCRVG